jgi:hypothetical protein
MKTLKFVTVAAVVVGAAVIVGLYVAVASAGTATKGITSYNSACAPLYCQDIPSATTTAIAEQ